jgi:hydroxyacylglutathione hydrolase
MLSGDFIFVGDVGRPDLLESAAGQAGVMEPAARALYDSLRSTAGLPGFLQILPAHGAGSACGKALGAVPGSVMDYERRYNAAFRLALEGERGDFVKTILEGQPEPPPYFARMKRDNRRGPALLPGGRLPVPKRVAGTELAEWVGVTGRSIVDLRSDRTAFMAKHVTGSLFAPLAGGKLSVSAGSYVGENDRLLLLVECEDDLESAVRDLVRIGLDHIDGWMPVSEALEVDGMTRALRRISTRDLDQELRDHADAVVMDVRGALEFAAGHVRGATNVAYTRLLPRIDEVPRDRSLLVHCGSGLRAAMATSCLAREGHEVVYVDGEFGDIPRELRS